MTQEEARALLEAPTPIPVAKRVLAEVYHPAAVLAAACAAAVVLLLAPAGWAWWVKLGLANTAAGCAAPGTRPWVLVYGFGRRIGAAAAGHVERGDLDQARHAAAQVLADFVSYCRAERAPAALAGLLAVILVLLAKGVMP